MKPGRVKPGRVRAVRKVSSGVVHALGQHRLTRCGIMGGRARYPHKGFIHSKEPVTCGACLKVMNATSPGEWSG